eukprot:900086_1
MWFLQFLNAVPTVIRFDLARNKNQCHPHAFYGSNMIVDCLEEGLLQLDSVDNFLCIYSIIYLIGLCDNIYLSQTLIKAAKQLLTYFQIQLNSVSASRTFLDIFEKKK